MNNNHFNQFNLNGFNPSYPAVQLNEHLLNNNNGLVENPIGLNQLNDDNEIFNDNEENNFEKK